MLIRRDNGRTGKRYNFAGSIQQKEGSRSLLAGEFGQVLQSCTSRLLSVVH